MKRKVCALVDHWSITIQAYQPSVNSPLESAAMTGAAYRRLDVDERRAQLLEVGTELFSTHSFEELSMAQIAREAGISKALLYHSFPSKEEFSRAPLAGGAADLARLPPADASLPPVEQVRASTRAFVSWIG